MIKNPTTFLLILSAALVLTAYCASGSSTDNPRDQDIAEQCYSGQITVYGEAPVFTSVSTSRNKAKEDACRTAVEKCIGAEVAQTAGVADAESLGFEIFSKTRGICRKGQIIEEEQYNLDTIKMLRVFMRYEVDRQEISRQINLLQKQVGNPRIMIMIREEYNLRGAPKRVEGFASRNGKVSAVLRDQLIKKGYTVIPSGYVRLGGVNEAAVAANPSTIPEAVKDAAVKADADVLIIGQVEINPQSISTMAGTDFKSYKATGSVSIQTLWGRGDTLGEYTQLANGAQVTDKSAAEAAAIRYANGADEYSMGGLARFTHSRMQSRWGEMTRNNVILLKIRGLEVSESGIFRDDLIERTAVRNVNEIRASGNLIEWEVTYPGRAFALRDILNVYGSNPAVFDVVRMYNKNIKVQEVKRGEISIQFE